MTNTSDKPASLSEKIYGELRDSILNGALKPGDRLLVLEITERLNVSQAPVREALERLKQEGLLKKEQNKSSIVSDISKKEIEEIYTLRELIEGYAVKKTMDNFSKEDLVYLKKIYLQMKQAAESDLLYRLIELDMDFHTFFYNNCGNTVILNLWNNIKANIMRFTSITNRIYFADLKSVTESHIPLIEALESGNQEKAETLFIDHMREVWWRMESQ
jgi:DNA-binding GntR family transcriptional regulator